MIELKCIKDEEEGVDPWEKQLDQKLEMIEDQLVMVQQEEQERRTRTHTA